MATPIKWRNCYFQYEMVDRERGSNRGLLYFWLTMAVGNVFWSALPHFLMLFKPDGFSPGTGKNVSSSSPLSSLGQFIQCVDNDRYKYVVLM